MGRPGRHEDDHLSEQFLVDGVAPAVIGGGAPESPFEVLPEPEPEPDPRGRHRAPPPPPRRVEPPTSPIPVVHALPPEPEQQKRKSWLARMFQPPKG
jgi:hypothetical protein